MKTVNYAIIGTGYFGAKLARIISEVEGAKLVTLYNRTKSRAQALADELGCEVSDSLEEAISRDDVDAVIVATPNYLHMEPVLLAANHKKHIFCEKPIALNINDTKKMIQAAKDNNVLFMAGHVMNFFNGVRTTKRLINEGKIGKPLYAHGARTGWEEPLTAPSWKKNRETSGGHLYHHIHELDLIQFLMGPAKTVTMVGGNVTNKNDEFVDEDDMLLLSLEFEDNTFGIMEYGSAFRWSEHYVLIQGSEGAIKLDMQDVGVTLRRKGVDEHFLLHDNVEEDEDRKNRYMAKTVDGAITFGKPGKTPPLWLTTIMRKEMEYFNQTILGGEVSEEFKPLLDGTAAQAAIATADAATLSLKENRKVDIKEVL